MPKSDARPQAGLKGSRSRPLEVGPDTFLAEIRFRMEPHETPKFRRQVKVGAGAKRAEKVGEKPGGSEGAGC